MIKGNLGFSDQDEADQDPIKKLRDMFLSLRENEYDGNVGPNVFRNIINHNGVDRGLSDEGLNNLCELSQIFIDEMVPSRNPVVHGGARRLNCGELQR